MRNKYAGFTLLELLVTIAIIAILAGILLPALSKAKVKAQSLQCLNNNRQLATATVLFASDSEDALPGNLDGVQVQNWANSNRTWCVGWLDNQSSRPDNTNAALLLNSQLGSYAINSGIYKCPGDRSTSQGQSRVRSYSMNCYMGNRFDSYTPGYSQYKKFTDIQRPSPSQAWLFMDEREDSINDGWFVVDMEGYDPLRESDYVLANYPASYHGGACSISFADGHAETKRWTDERTKPGLRSGSPLPLLAPSPGNRDVAWLQERSSARTSGATR